MEPLKWEYDVLASEALRHLQSATEDRGDSHSLLKRCHTSHPILERFWRATRMFPVWVDSDQMERDQAVCRCYAVPMMIVFAFQSFAGEIAAALGPAEVFVRTGGLSQ
jgi:hypothetical protein